jgi:hypothetical protein
MPSFSITRRDAIFAGTVKDTNSPRPSLWKLYLWKLYRTTAFAPSVVRLAPMTRRQSPTNFHAGCEMCLE